MQVAYHFFKFKAPGKPTVESVSDKTIQIGFTELSDTSHTYTYRAEAKASGGVVHESKCDSNTKTCLFKELTPACFYAVSVRACFSLTAGTELCSSSSESVKTWTLPSG